MLDSDSAVDPHQKVRVADVAYNVGNPEAIPRIQSLRFLLHYSAHHGAHLLASFLGIAVRREQRLYERVRELGFALQRTGRAPNEIHHALGSVRATQRMPVEMRLELLRPIGPRIREQLILG